MRTRLGALALALSSGCYLSHERPVPPPPPCVIDADCDDADRCTADRCTLGECAHDPIPFDWVRPTAEGGIDVSADERSVWRLVVEDGRLVAILLEGSRVDVAPVSPSGPPWDAALAVDGTALVVLSRASETELVLDRVDRGVATRSLLAAPGTTELELRRRPGGFVASAVLAGVGCWVGWADRSARWTGATMLDATLCHGVSVDGVGTPPTVRPVRVTERGTAVFHAIDASGLVTRVEVGPGGVLDTTTYPLGGAESFALVAVEDEDRTGVLWAEDVEGPTRSSFGVLDADDVLIAPPVVDVPAAGSYALSTTMAYCSARFVAVSSRDYEPRIVRQADRDGRALGTTIELPAVDRANRVEIACRPGGGVVVTSLTATHVLDCR